MKSLQRLGYNGPDTGSAALHRVSKEKGGEPMITDSFDPAGEEIVKAKDTISQKDKDLARRFSIHTFILTFSGKLIAALREEGLIQPLHEDLTIGSAAYRTPIFRIRDSSIGVVLSGIGAPMIAGILEELSTLFHARNYIVFGSCGALTDLPEGRLIVPTQACRDEGTSYHYAPPGDYIAVRNAAKLARLFDELGIEYVQGKTWTTDAFYRETERNREKRAREGCLCVEMECSAAQAVCDYRGLELYQFVYAADSLEGKWARRILGDLEKDTRIKYFSVAWEIAKRIE